MASSNYRSNKGGVFSYIQYLFRGAILTVVTKAHQPQLALGWVTTDHQKRPGCVKMGPFVGVGLNLRLIVYDIRYHAGIEV